MQDTILSNAANGNTTIHSIDKFDPVCELAIASSNCFKQLHDEDHHVESIRWDVWNIRQSVVCTIWPFNSQQLSLKSKLSLLEGKRIFYPALEQEIETICRTVDWLIDNPSNPKREAVFKILRSSKEANEEHGIVTCVGRGMLEGWNEELYRVITEISAECRLIPSRTALRRGLFDRVILATAGRACPIYKDLLESGHSRELDIVAYDIERPSIPKKRSLPATSFNYEKKSSGGSDSSNSEIEKADSLTQWESEGFWQEIRSKLGIHDQTDDEKEYLVNSRLVLLPNGKMVYLDENLKTIELSSVMYAEQDYLESLSKYPRKKVRELEAGDYIVLRTLDSGSYLDEVVRRLMKEEGRYHIKEKATEWKKNLRNALVGEGITKIYSTLVKKGHNLSNPHYLWAWTTTQVIAPGNDSRFFELLAILQDMGYFSANLDIVAYAEEHWSYIRELKKYHHRAGLRIRKELFAKLTETLIKGETIVDSLEFEVEGVSSGALAIFRVVGVDPMTFKVPYHEVGQVKESLF